MKQTDSVISLDPIERTRKKQDSVISRLFKTRHYGGKGMARTDEYGHYLFVGKQRSGKSVSCLWWMEYLIKKYVRQNKNVMIYSNMGFGVPVRRSNLHDLICNIQFDDKFVHIFVIDEIQSWFPKDTKNKFTLDMIDNLTGDFSQLAKRQIYVLSTAQVYGRLNKNLREQCLYMVDCRRSKITNQCVCDFIPGDDVICDDLGRWSGIPRCIKVHGLPVTSFDTHRLISIS